MGKVARLAGCTVIINARTRRSETRTYSVAQTSYNAVVVSMDARIVWVAFVLCSGSIFLHGDNNSEPLARVTHTRNNYVVLGKRWN